MLLPFVGWHILSLSCFVTVTGHCWKRTSVPCLMKRSSCDHLHCDDQRCHRQPSPNFLETSLPKEKDKQFGIWEQDFCYFIAVSFAKWLKGVHNFKLSTFSTGLRASQKKNMASLKPIIKEQNCFNLNLPNIPDIIHLLYPLLLHCSS